MTTIEDRLHGDAQATTGAPSGDRWDDVVERADARTARAQLVSRVAIGAFVLIGAVAAFVNLSTGVETVDGPTDLADGATEPVLGAWSEASPWLALATWLIPWAGAVAVIGLAYLTSPQDFRAPYLVPRIPRAVVACAAAILWSGAIIIAALPSYLLSEWDPLLWTYIEARSVFTVAIVVGGFFLVSFTNYQSSGKAAGAFLLWLIASAFISGLVPDESQVFLLDWWLTAIAVLGTSATAAFSLYTVNVLGFRPNWSRLTVGAVAAQAPRYQAGAALIVAGLLVVAIAVSQAVVLRVHLFELVPDIDGFTQQVTVIDDPLTGDTAPSLNVTVRRTGPPRDPQLDTFLIESGFEPDVNALGLGWQRPRGDAFGHINAFTNNGPDRSENGISFFTGYARTRPVEVETFDAMRIARNVGYGLAVSGLLLIWSKTAISRFLVGPQPWTRRTRSREMLGWALVIAAATFPFLWFVEAGFGFRVLLAAGLWWVGAHLLVPAPQRSLDEHSAKT